MYVIAIHDLKENRQDLAGALADILKVTPFEALSRLRAPGNGPCVVGIVADQEEAARLSGELKANGFTVVTLSDNEIEVEADQWTIRRFEFSDQNLTVESNAGKRLTIASRAIRLLLRGIGISSSTGIETVKKRKLDLASAVISGGLKVMKTTKTVREVTKEEREGFLMLYAAGHPTLAFHENGLVYDALGPSRGLSRSANFIQLIGELRRRCPAAQYDERLLNKANQTALLGPLLSPDAYIVIATALLAKVLRNEPREPA
jgi:hypothetical protein